MSKQPKRSVMVGASYQSGDPERWEFTVNRLPKYGGLIYSEPDADDIPADVLNALLRFATSRDVQS